MKHLQLQEVKARFSQIVKTVLTDGPCEVTIHGKPAVVILSKKEYEKMLGPKESLLTFLQSAPFDADKLKITRIKSSIREVDL